MKSAATALMWEMIWKNRVVFPALAVLLALGSALAVAAGAYAADRPWWLGYARGIVVFGFLSSLVLAYAPFTLMEGHPGWRMNSMITRWFVLPVRTSVLVLLPLMAAAAFLTLVFGAWVPLLGRALGPGLDSRYFLASLLLGMVLMQTVAWVVPRRPAQYWSITGLVLPATLLLALLPQDQPDTSAWRQAGPARFAVVSLVLGGFALFAASRNRRGDWPGHIPWETLGLRWREGRRRDRSSGGPGRALFRSDVLPALRFLILSWLLLAAAVLGLSLLSVARRHPGTAPNAEVLVYAAVQLLPFLGTLWLAVWGLSLGCEPGSGFRTPLTSFRSTLPLTPGLLVGPRVVGVLLGWLVVWLPLALLAAAVLPHLHGVWDYDGADTIRSALAWRMALSAHLVAGALPLLLWGRLEGFPNLLLAGLCAWAWTWMLAGFLGTEQPGSVHWIMGGTLLALKLACALAVFAEGLRARRFGWWYVVGVFTGWGLSAACVLNLLPAELDARPWRVLGVVLMLPLVRPATCPLAMAANRCR